MVKYLFYRLIIFLDTANENDTNYNIAWYMANNFKKVAHMGISEMAKACYVSPATISRFCRTLGYENFAHLKLECEIFQKNMVRYDNLARVPMELLTKNPSSATESYVKDIVTQLEELRNYLDWNEIDASLKLIHDANKWLFLGHNFPIVQLCIFKQI